MRLFLAIDIPENLKNIIDKEIDFLKRDYPNFTWVPKENFHITLFFFGDTDRIEIIDKKIKELIYDQNSFHLFASGADLFIHRKIVIFINFRREKRIEILANKIKKTFDPLFNKNFNKNINKKFIPHLTIARAKIPSKQQYFLLKKRLSSLTIDASFLVKNISLYQSIISGKRPVYKKIKTYILPLNQKAQSFT